MSTSSPLPGRPFVVGASHRSSALALRDRLFVEEKDFPRFLAGLRAAGVMQAVVLSTCDRVEIQAVHSDPKAGAEVALAALAAHGGVTPDELAGQTYTLFDDAALRQVFAVPASLESLTIGEPEVLGQVKASHARARDAGSVGPELEAIFQAAYVAAKRVRTETGIGRRPVSIAAAAIEVARDVHGELGARRGLLIGGGEMGELIARELLAAGLGQLTVAHPNEGRAEFQARALGCHVSPLEPLAERLAEADVVVASVGARRQLVTVAVVVEVLRRRKRRPIFLIDAAVPGDIDPAANDVDGAFVYDLSDLERVALKGRATREGEAESAWRILEEEMTAFQRARVERAAVPALVHLRQHFEEARTRALVDSGSDADKATRLLIGRLLHGPTAALRDLAAGGVGGVDLETVEKVLRRLFEGDDQEDSGTPKEKESED